MPFGMALALPSGSVVDAPSWRLGAGRPEMYSRSKTLGNDTSSSCPFENLRGPHTDATGIRIKSHHVIHDFTSLLPFFFALILHPGLGQTF